MSRVPLLTPETAPQAAKPFLENALKGSGFIPNLLGYWPTHRLRWKPTSPSPA